MSHKYLRTLDALRAQLRQQRKLEEAKARAHEQQVIPEQRRDADFFAQAMKGVRPLKTANRIPVQTLRPPLLRLPQKPQGNPPVPVHWSDEFCNEIPDDTENRYHYIHPDADTRSLARLKKNYWHIQDELDLHGHTREQARTVLARFLAQALHKKLRCVCVIHGRGYGPSGHEPVLKPLVRRWLRQHDDVLAFCSAHLSDEESGALKVLLR